MLTKKRIEETKPDPNRVIKLWDGAGEAGSGSLYLEISPKNCRSWRVRFREKRKGKSVVRVVTLGRYPAMSIQQARRERDAWMAENNDLVRTFKEVAIDYIKTFKDARSPGWALYQAHRLANLKALFPRSIEALRADEVRAELLKISGRGSYEMAKKVARLAARIMDHAVVCGDLPGGHTMAGIARSLPPAPSFKRRAAVKPDEVPALLKAISAYDGDLPTRAALRLLFMSTLRVTSLLSARWDWIEAGLLTIPSDVMKVKGRPAFQVPLSRQAQSILAELATASRAGFIFKSIDRPLQPISGNAVLFAFYRMGWKSRQTSHGVRSIFETVMNEMREAGVVSYSAELISAQNSHKVGNAVRQAYTRTDYLQQRAEMLQFWSDWLEENGLVMKLMAATP